MNKKSERLEFRADPEFIRKIQQLADEDGVTKAEILRRAIGLYSYAANLSREGLVLQPGKAEENVPNKSDHYQSELAMAG